MSKTKAGADEALDLALVPMVVWACMFAAMAATLYFLLKEPEDGVTVALDHAMSMARSIAVGTSVAGSILGVWRVVRDGAGPDLLGMAVLFNVIVACFWALRIVLVPAV